MDPAAVDELRAISANTGKARSDGLPGDLAFAVAGPLRTPRARYRGPQTAEASAGVRKRAASRDGATPNARL
ncbi:hypothetical protein GCM10027570_46690 [Streptomonospora sediminis]